MKKAALFIVILQFSILVLKAQSFQDNELIDKVEQSLQILVQYQNEVKDIHPLLKKFYPVVLSDNKKIYLFTYSEDTKRYKLIISKPEPFAMIKGIRAAFPMAIAGGKTVAVITKDIFDSKDGYAVIMHEFIHCGQAETVEYELKTELAIAQKAEKNGDYQWEIAYNFPYDSNKFVDLYGAYLGALDKEDTVMAQKHRKALKTSLTPEEFEYLAWLEWKEGMARFIQNKILDRWNMPLSKGGGEKPFNRVSFYYSGSNYINMIYKGKSSDIDLKKLFTQLIMKEQ